MPAENEQPSAADVIDFVRRMKSSRCCRCGEEVCGHQLVIDLAMGYKERPLCVSCLCEQLGQDPGAFLEHAVTYIRHRDCYGAGWSWASRDEGVGESDDLPCLVRPGGRRGGSGDRSRTTGAEPGTFREVGDAEAPDAEWDAGDLSCGDLVLELRLRMQALDPGRVFRLTARDPSARKDLPAWCRLTGHALVRASHPDYWIRRGPT